MLSRFGELLQTYDYSTPGVQRRPLLCQVDADSSALVADQANHTLQVMTSDGMWSVVDFDEAVMYPAGAVWCNASLYVAKAFGIVRFSQQEI